MVWTMNLISGETSHGIESFSQQTNKKKSPVQYRDWKFIPIKCQYVIILAYAYDVCSVCKMAAWKSLIYAGIWWYVWRNFINGTKICLSCFCFSFLIFGTHYFIFSCREFSFPHFLHSFLSNRNFWAACAFIPNIKWYI